MSEADLRPESGPIMTTFTTCNPTERDDRPWRKSWSSMDQWRGKCLLGGREIDFYEDGPAVERTDEGRQVF